jgi:methionine--tRNA ligase beta chain
MIPPAHPMFLFLAALFCYPVVRPYGGAMISIDAFRQIELKVATVKSAEPHPNADKLMVLQIDLGTEQRQICAGIRNQYTPEELVGRQIVVVANLETAKLRGLESQGMLLAASDEERVIFLTPEKPVQPGSRVS